MFKKIYSGDKTSIGEEFAKKVLEYLFNNPHSPFKDIIVQSIWPDWLVSPSGHVLELDAYVEEAAFAMEFNGPYHNNPELISKMFGITIGDARAKVAAVAAKDKLKSEACRKRGIDLLVLKYSLSYEEIFEVCCRFVADLFNRRNADSSERVDWRDFNIDWREILSSVKRIRVENILKRFNIRQVLNEEFEDI